MPNHAFCTWARDDSGRRSWLRVGRHTHTHTYSTPAQATQTQTTNLQRLATKAALNPMHNPLRPNGSNLRPWNCSTAKNHWRTQLEHGANMPRTWNGSCAPIVGTSLCSFLAFNSYTGWNIPSLETLAPSPFAVLSVWQFHKFHHSDAQSANGSPICVPLPKTTSLEHMFYSNIARTYVLEHMFTNMSNMSNICSWCI